MDSTSVGVRISTRLTGADSPEAVHQALRNLFPATDGMEFTSRVARFPATEQSVEWTTDEVDMEQVLSLIHESRTLDTALDAMSMNLDSRGTRFSLSRQAALSGKVSFCLPGEEALGGVIEVELSGKDIGIWLEEATWHRGRDDIPRTVGDDASMKRDGVSRDWHS